jgi:hypothetical protein
MQRHKILTAVMALTLLIGSALFLFGCGGGSSGTGTTTGATGTTGGPTTGTTGGLSSGMMGGQAVKGPVNGATVTAYGISNGMMGAQLASTTTNSLGNFTISLGDYTGPLVFQMAGGTYIDEATGATMTVDSGNVMTAVMTSLSTGSTGTTLNGIQITPLTSMAQAIAKNMAGGLTDANIAAANAAVGTYFMVSDILHVQPINPLVTNSGAGATQDSRNYGMAIAAMTQYAKDLGMTTSSSIVTAMMNDASDGIMNGMMGSTTITMGGMIGSGTMMQSTAGTSGLATALTEFMGSVMNRSGLTLSDMQTLIDQLSSSNGVISGTTSTITIGGTTTTGTMAGGMISGKAVYGPIKSGTVAAFAVNNGAIGAQLASSMTDAGGNFTMSIGSYSGPVMLLVSNGTYTDLATGSAMTMAAGDVMTAVIPTISSGATVTGIQVTPLTSMAQLRAQYMTGGMIDANIMSANTAVSSYFMISDILYTLPVDPLVTASGIGATQDMINYGATIAAMSQYATNIGMASSSAIITAFMDDASDGVMNGLMGSNSITMGGMMGGMMGGGTVMQSTAGTSGLATAMSQFMGSTLNKSGLTATDVQTLINQLTTSSGTL